MKNNFGKPYITEDKNYDGKIFWADWLTECFEGPHKHSMNNDIHADSLKIEDKYVLVEWGKGMRNNLI